MGLSEISQRSIGVLGAARWDGSRGAWPKRRGGVVKPPPSAARAGQERAAPAQSDRVRPRTRATAAGDRRPSAGRTPRRASRRASASRLARLVLQNPTTWPITATPTARVTNHSRANSGNTASRGPGAPNRAPGERSQPAGPATVTGLSSPRAKSPRSQAPCHDRTGMSSRKFHRGGGNLWTPTSTPRWSLCTLSSGLLGSKADDRHSRSLRPGESDKVARRNVRNARRDPRATLISGLRQQG